MSERKADRVARDLLAHIVSGDLPVGSLLPKESQLAEQYGVNRGVVREANKLLEVHGLVHPIKRRGTEVLDPRESLSPEVLRAMLQGTDDRIRPDVLAEFLEIRAELDRLMCGLAAERRTDEDVALMEALLARAEAVVDDQKRYGEVMDGLGLLLASASRNRIFAMLAHWHRKVYREFEALFDIVRMNPRAHLVGAGMLVGAVKDGNRELTETIVSTFHEWAGERLLEMASTEN